VQQIVRALVRLGGRHAVHHPRRQRDVLHRRHVREQVERLEHDRHPALRGGHVRARVGDVDAVEEHLAVVDLLQQVDAPRTEISPTSFCSATKSLSSGGSTRRTAWGRITSRIDRRWVSPRDRAAACCDGCTDSMPARNTSAT